MEIRIDIQTPKVTPSGYLTFTTCGVIEGKPEEFEHMRLYKKMLPVPAVTVGMVRVRSEYRLNPAGTRCEFRLVDTNEPRPPEEDPKPIIVG